MIGALQVFSDDDDDDDDECLHNAHPSNGHTSALICSVTSVTHDSLIFNSVGSYRRAMPRRILHVTDSQTSDKATYLTRIFSYLHRMQLGCFIY